MYIITNLFYRYLDYRLSGRKVNRFNEHRIDLLFLQALLKHVQYVLLEDLKDVKASANIPMNLSFYHMNVKDNTIFRYSIEYLANILYKKIDPLINLIYDLIKPSTNYLTLPYFKIVEEFILPCVKMIIVNNIDSNKRIPLSGLELLVTL